ncbi:MAG: beta-ketoacyl-ACP synthase I [Planctomycetes bacterium]|nr:beta-ketoacyl-ACP synthase I [Planctomycetota bacterium]
MRRVAITGIGIITPLGRGAEENTAALREGRSGIVSMRPAWAEKGMRSQVAGFVDAGKFRDAFSRKENRFLCDAALLSGVALRDAIEHSKLSLEEVEDPRTGLVIGTGAGSSMRDAVELVDRLRARGGARVGAFHVPLVMGSSITANLATLFHIHGHSYSVTSACATSAHALMTGLDLIRSGRQVRVFAGGAEDVNEFSAAGFDGMGALSAGYNDEPHRASRPLDRGRDGFVFAGGAGVVVLEDLEAARARGGKVWAILQGAAATCDGEDMVVPNRVGAESAMRLALQDAGIAPESVDYINLHGTSTPTGDLKEIEALLSVFGKKTPPFSSTKSMTGHTLGAAGVHEAIFCCLMMNGQFLAPNINLEHPESLVEDLPVVRQCSKAKPQIVLSNSFGFGGTNCTLVLSSDGIAP